MNKQQQTWLGTTAGVALLIALGGCDDSTNMGSGSQSSLGKSAEYAKGVAGDIAARDAQLGGAADALTGAGERVELSGLVWSIPASWENKGAGMMAQVELALPSTTSYQVRAKFYAGIQGSVQDNLDRWARMMTDSAGTIEPRISESTLDGVKVTIFEMEGNYAERLPSGTSINRNNFAFRAAVAEGPGGNVFIRLVGPQHDVEEAEADFLNMVSSMRRK